MSDADEHQKQRLRSTKNLTKAREHAEKKKNFNSVDSRSTMTRLFGTKAGYEPYPWQLDVAESLMLGLDSVVIAGTGSGKTIPFMLPLLLQRDKMMLIISPLKELQRDQVRRFRKMDIPSLAINGDTWSPSLGETLAKQKHQAIFASPEMCIKHALFRKWLTDSATTNRILGIIIDETHCISQWGGDFRPLYAQVDKIRSFMPARIPVLATSATLHPAALDDVSSILKISMSNAYVLNLGNHRKNIRVSVKRMNNAKDYAAIRDHLPKADAVLSPDDLPKTIIFTNSVNDTQVLCRDLRQVYGDNLKNSIAYLHANRTDKAKRRIMKDFRLGYVRVLVATEAAGMGADIPDITLAIQIGVPKSLAIWTQRAGRAGRSAGLQAHAIMLVEKSMFSQRKKRAPKTKKQSTQQKKGSKKRKKNHEAEATTAAVNDRVDAEELEWVKDVDEDMRKYVSTDGCRTNEANRFFNNPPQDHASQNCGQCDNCLRETTNLNERPQTPQNNSSSDESAPPSPPTSPSKRLNGNRKRAMSTQAPAATSDPTTPTTNDLDDDREEEEGAGEENEQSGPKGPSFRRGPLLEAVRAALRQWRIDIQKKYSPSPFNASVYLPDTVITTISANRSVTNVEEMRDALSKKNWVYLDRHGQDVLKVIADTEREWKEQRQAEVAANAAKKKEEMAACQEAARQQKVTAAAAARQQRYHHAYTTTTPNRNPLANSTNTYSSYPYHPSHPSTPTATPINFIPGHSPHTYSYYQTYNHFHAHTTQSPACNTPSRPFYSTNNPSLPSQHR